MALRNILKADEDSDILRKKSRDVEVIDDRILTLLDDMRETMTEANGVGLAAPQVGVLKKVVVIDIGEGLIELINPVIVYQKGEQFEEEGCLIVMINPKIIEMSGEQTGGEGCLSVPGKSGVVKRPQKVIVRALNRKGETLELEAEDLLAIACCHEIDHLSGILYQDKVIEVPEELK